MSLLKDKVAIITGASTGIGRATAIEFSKQGAKLVLADINIDAIKETAQLVKDIGGEAITVSTDVTQYDACENMVAQAINSFGKLDILFNNAGIAGDRAMAVDTPLDMWQKVIDVNLTGVFHCIKSALPAMVENKSGVIINTASVDGLVGMSTIAPYVASKHGVIGLTKTIALEYSRRGIRSIAICPGFVKTPMTEVGFSAEEIAMFKSITPIGDGASPEQIADFVTYLASDKASFINGSAHQIDGGLLAGVGIVE
jgi:NAD(P)-dependent dehydrogenase (short-subunit alcohol dehydrogenase family)